VTNAGNDTVTTYTHAGTRTSPTIANNGLMEPMGITVDANGKIYVANEGCNTVTTYWPSGGRTSLTITRGLNAPTGVAVWLYGTMH
jgi:DNA-binding beta-propeller fold protein YncE